MPFRLPRAWADPIAGPAEPEDVRWSATVACGLDKFIQRFELTGLVCYYKGRHGNANDLKTTSCWLDTSA